jgi:hypothetical protein
MGPRSSFNPPARHSVSECSRPEERDHQEFHVAVHWSAEHLGFFHSVPMAKVRRVTLCVCVCV